MVLPMAASWQAGSLIQSRSCAAPAAAGVQVAASGAVLSSSSASSSAPVDRRAADGASVRHESSPVKRLPCNTRRSRRHGNFRRSTYRAGFHVQNDFGEIVGVDPIVGGGGVDVIIGIKYLKHYTTFLFSLPSGLSVYKAKL